jgi:hypothetical protein
VVSNPARVLNFIILLGNEPAFFDKSKVISTILLHASPAFYSHKMSLVLHSSLNVSADKRTF